MSRVSGHVRSTESETRTGVGPYPPELTVVRRHNDKTKEEIMSEKITLSVPTTLKDIVDIKRVPEAGNGEGRTIIETCRSVSVEFFVPDVETTTDNKHGFNISSASYEINERTGKHELKALHYNNEDRVSYDFTLGEVALLRELLYDVTTRESEYLVDKLHKGLDGETNDARLFVRDREERLQKLESLFDRFPRTDDLTATKR